jgi:hypothetical protein
VTGFRIEVGKDIASLEELVASNWFKEEVLRKVGNGGATSFWRDKWLGNTPLCNIFRRLFLILEQKEGVVRDFRVCDRESGVDSYLA